MIGRQATDDRDAVVAAARNRCLELLLVDGCIYKPAPEPVLELRTRPQLHHDRSQLRSDRSLHLLLDGRKNLSQDGTPFRLDEFDTAIRIGEGHCTANRHNLEILGELDLVGADLLEESFRAHSASRLETLCRGIGFHGFAECTTAQIRGWCTAQDLFDLRRTDEAAAALRAWHDGAKDNLQDGDALNISIALSRYETLPSRSPEELDDFNI